LQFADGVHDRIDRLLRRPVFLTAARFRLTTGWMSRRLSRCLSRRLSRLRTGLRAALRSPRGLTAARVPVPRRLRRTLLAAGPAAALAVFAGALFRRFFRGFFHRFFRSLLLPLLPRLLRELLLQLGQLFETHTVSCKNDA
jgi:hypothetical protein